MLIKVGMIFCIRNYMPNIESKREPERTCLISYFLILSKYLKTQRVIQRIFVESWLVCYWNVCQTGKSSPLLFSRQVDLEFTNILEPPFPWGRFTLEIHVYPPQSCLWSACGVLHAVKGASGILGSFNAGVPVKCYIDTDTHNRASALLHWHLTSLIQHANTDIYYQEKLGCMACNLPPARARIAIAEHLGYTIVEPRCNPVKIEYAEGIC